MDKETKVKLAEIIVETLGGIPADTDGWRQMATLGSRLRMMGVDFRQYGYAKLRPFIESFDNILELRQVESLWLLMSVMMASLPIVPNPASTGSLTDR